MGKYILVFVTCSSGKEARIIADRLLNKKLVACANIISGISSHFWWKGRLDNSKEALLMMKTAAKNFSKIAATVKKYHSYEVPEIIGLPVLMSDKNYEGWLRESISLTGL